uniref:Uncharacterized protein n=1 Tax=Ananas comosus var. bracteatus TaxID=296719 RepID=A0A6V7PEZ3_ANACO|nr:unnamed protein product [Ananas comosus var. bracteatus]
MFARAVSRSLRGRVGQTHSMSRNVGLPQTLRRHKLDCLGLPLRVRPGTAGRELLRASFLEDDSLGSAGAPVQNLHWSRNALGDRSLAGGPVPSGVVAELSGTGLSDEDRSPGDRSLRQGPVPEREIPSARKGSLRGPVFPNWDRSLTAKMPREG